jgi:hypothetical protein
VTELIKAKLDQINDVANIDFKIVQKRVTKMRKVHVQGNFITDLVCDR